MRLLLIAERPENSSFFPNILPPLGILYLSAVCRQNNIDHEVYDYNIGKCRKGDYSEFDVIGLSVNNANFPNSLELARRIKKNNPGAVLIVGGPLASARPQIFLKEEIFDVIFIGEAEYSLIDFLKGKEISKIPGIIYRQNGEIKENEQVFLENLDAIPFPDLGRIDIKKYRLSIQKASPVSSLISSRGCPYRCSFCFHNMGYKWRYRSVKNIMEEIEFQHIKLGVKELCIVDDNFTNDIERAERIAGEIIKAGYKLKIQFNNAVRTEKITKEFLEIFKKAGLWYLSVAPESANEMTLQKIRKGLDANQLNNVIRWGRELDLFVHACFMVGFPWENEEDIEETLKLAVGTESHLSQVSRVTIFPKTELYEQVNRETPVKDISESLFFGAQNFENKKIASSVLNRMIKKANYRKYFNIKNLYEIYRHLGINGIYKLAKFGILSNNL